MTPELNVATQDDFLELVEQKDFRIAKAKNFVSTVISKVAFSSSQFTVRT